MFMKVKVDEGTRAVIHNGVTAGQRSIFVITGNKPQDQIAKLYFILMEKGDKISRGVVWGYGDKPVLGRHKINVAKQLESLSNYGVLYPDPPFSLFLEFAPIKGCWYKDSERILGNTFGMCILQDLEALTPNILARTLETVDVGGLVVLLIPSSSSNVRERFPTSGAVNEHFLLSLASCKPYIVMDDDLNILPISSQPQLEEDFTRLMIHQGMSAAASASPSPPYGIMDTHP